MKVCWHNNESGVGKRGNHSVSIHLDYHETRELYEELSTIDPEELSLIEEDILGRLCQVLRAIEMYETKKPQATYKPFADLKRILETA